YHASKDLWNRMPRIGQRALTFLLVSLGWIFFRADSFSHALSWWHNLWAVHGGPWTIEQRKLWLYIVGGLYLVNAFPNASSYKKFIVLPPLWQVGLGALTVMAILFMNYSS